MEFPVGTAAGDAKEFAPGMTFRWCPPGRFKMGTASILSLLRISYLTWIWDHEAPVWVQLGSGFWLAETLLTQRQWQTVMGSAPWQGHSEIKEGDDFPATYVSHDDAVLFCEKLTERERLSGRLASSGTYRLPTESQWEYACRAGTKTKFSFGDDDSQLEEYAWFYNNCLSVGEAYPHEVRRKKPNPWRFYDMHGNVWEWCLDWDGPKPVGGVDPRGVPSGTHRIIRGGSWRPQKTSILRSAYRGCSMPHTRSDIGFRVAFVCEPEG